MVFKPESSLTTSPYRATPTQVRRATEKTQKVWKAAVKTAERGVLRLELATKLVNDLVEEAEKWDKQTDTWRDVRELLVGDLLMATAMAVLAAPLRERERDLLLTKWKLFLQSAVAGKPMAVSLDPFYSLSVVTEAERIKWPMYGVEPEDRHANYSAIATGLLADSSSCVLIDPDMVGLTWLRLKFSDQERPLKEIDVTAPDLGVQLRKAAAKGLAVVLMMHGEAAIEPSVAAEVIMPFLARSIVYNEVEEEEKKGKETGKDDKKRKEEKKEKEKGKEEGKEEGKVGEVKAATEEDGEETEGGGANPQGEDGDATNAVTGGEAAGAGAGPEAAATAGAVAEAAEAKAAVEEVVVVQQVAPPVPRKPFLVLPKEQIPFDPAFSLAIHTTARTPVFSKRLQSVTSTVDWTPSSGDLQAQTLTILFKQEHPKLEQNYRLLRTKTVQVRACVPAGVCS